MNMDNAIGKKYVNIINDLFLNR